MRTFGATNLVGTTQIWIETQTGDTNGQPWDLLGEIDHETPSPTMFSAFYLAPEQYARRVFDPISWFLAATAAVQVSAIALCLSLVTIVIAIGSLITAVRSLNATRRQEKRRKPQITLTYLSSSKDTTSTGTEYLFRIRAKNPTDSNNAITAAELEIHYFLNDQLVSLRIASSSATGALSVPASIPAGSSIEGTIRFWAVKELLAGRFPRDFVLHLLDTFGTAMVMPVEIVYENRSV